MKTNVVAELCKSYHLPPFASSVHAMDAAADLHHKRDGDDWRGERNRESEEEEYDPLLEDEEQFEAPSGRGVLRPGLHGESDPGEGQPPGLHGGSDPEGWQLPVSARRRVQDPESLLLQRPEEPPPELPEEVPELNLQLELSELPHCQVKTKAENYYAYTTETYQHYKTEERRKEVKVKEEEEERGGEVRKGGRKTKKEEEGKRKERRKKRKERTKEAPGHHGQGQDQTYKKGTQAQGPDQAQGQGKGRNGQGAKWAGAKAKAKADAKAK